MTGKVFGENAKQLSDWLKLNTAIEEVGEVPCRNAPDLYFPENPTKLERTTSREAVGAEIASAKLAKQACKACPVINQCAEYAIKHREVYGIWGGLSPLERKTIWKKMK